MPIYEYRCATCGTAFEAFLPIGAGAPPCLACGASTSERRISRLASIGAADCAPGGGGT